MGEATRKPGECQVRSKMQSPCLHQAEVEISGIPFCEACAREQEAYIAIGELTGGKHTLRSKPLADVLERMRRERELTGDIIASKRNRVRSTNPPKRPSRGAVLTGSRRVYGGAGGASGEAAAHAQ